MRVYGIAFPFQSRLIVDLNNELSNQLFLSCRRRRIDGVVAAGVEKKAIDLAVAMGKKPGPQKGKRKRDFDVYKDDAKDAGFPVPRSDTVPNRQRDARALAEVKNTQWDRLKSSVELRAISAFQQWCKEEGKDLALQRSADEFCGYKERTSQWQRAHKSTLQQLIEDDIARDPRGAKELISDREGKRLRRFLEQGTDAEISYPWANIGAMHCKKDVSASTVKRKAHKMGVYDGLAEMKTILDEQQASSRRDACDYWLRFKPDHVVWRQIRVSDESHEGVWKIIQNHQKRPLGMRYDEEKIERIDTRSRKKGLPAGSKEAIALDAKAGPVNGDEDKRQAFRSNTVHFWAAVGVGHKSPLYFYDIPSNQIGKMTGAKYTEILKWYCSQYPRGAEGTADDWILGEDRDTAHGTHGKAGRLTPLCIQSRLYWEGDSDKPVKGPNNIDRLKLQLGIRWFFFLANSSDLNIIENLWAILGAKFTHLRNMTKRQKQVALQDI